MTEMTYPAHLQPTRTVTRTYAFLVRVFGPADSWDNPLMGTKYDPRMAEHRQREAVALRRARAAARAQGARAQGAQAAPRSTYDAFAPAYVS